MRPARTSRRYLAISAVQERAGRIGRAGLLLALLMSAVTSWAACPKATVEFQRAIDAADAVVRGAAATCFVQTSVQLEDPTVAALALDVLEELGDSATPEVANILVASARSNEAGVRRVAYRGLGRVFAHGDNLPPQVLQALQAGLWDERVENRIEAAQSLALLHRFAGPTEGDLQAIAWNPKEPPDLRKVAQTAVEQITGKPIEAPWISRSADSPAPQAGAAGSSIPDEPSR